MPHPTGERLHCDECGAEIMFVKACPCSDDPKKHSDVCCGKEMRSLGVGTIAEPMRSEATPTH